MKRKRSILLGLAAIAAIGGGAYFFSAARTHAEVERLIGEAHGRGIYTSPVTPARNQYLGANAATKFAGIERLRELRALDVEPQNIGTARTLIASADAYFAPIAEFAELKTYAPHRDFASGGFEDMSPISAAIHAEGWRGYLLAHDGDFEGALNSIRILKGFMERMQDEGYPIGLAIAPRAQDRVNKIALKLAEQAAGPTAIERIIISTKTMPRLDFKHAFTASLGFDLQAVDDYQNGKYDPTPPTKFLNLRISFGKSTAYFDALRRDLLRIAIHAYDNWDAPTQDMLGRTSIDMTGMDIAEEFLSSFQMTADSLRRSDRNALANRRALALTLAAHKHRLETGAMPTVAQLEKGGLNATDPWGGKKMTLHVDGKRIWVGGERKSRMAISQSLETMAILDWRH